METSAYVAGLWLAFIFAGSLFVLFCSLLGAVAMKVTGWGELWAPGDRKRLLASFFFGLILVMATNSIEAYLHLQ